MTTAAAATRRRREPHRFDLAGAAVLFLEPSHAIPIVSMVVSLRTGSAHDPAGRTGLARLGTRMLRRGCEGMGAREIEDAIDRLGAEMAVDTAASTVAIHAQVIARNVDAFVDLLGRLLATPTFPDEELQRLKRESIAELVEARDNDRVVAQKAFQRALFVDHPYGHNPGGTSASLASIEGADVRDFYVRAFVRTNIVIGFAGDLTPERAPELAERILAGLPPGERVPEAVDAPVLVPGRRLVFVDKPDRTQTQILIGTLGTWPRDPDHVALAVGNAVFGGTFTSRLMKEVRSKRGWSYGAHSRLSIDRERQAFSMWTFPSAEDATKCIELELRLLEAWLEKGVTPRETSFVQRFLIRSHAFDVDTAAKRLNQALDVELLGLPPDYYSAWTARVAEVTAEAASKAARERIRTDALLAVVVGTQTQILEGVRAAIPALESCSVVPFDAE